MAGQIAATFLRVAPKDFGKVARGKIQMLNDRLNRPHSRAGFVF
ncbi:hypothetical protein [Devosia nitrariae]|nr:hypothetical protein [Devosia nitrariae]